MLAAWGLMLSAGAEWADAQSYTFSIVARRGQVIDGQTLFGFPAGPSLNGSGQVAFSATTNPNGNTSGVFKGLSLIAGTGQSVGGKALTGVFGGPWINSSGDVAYAGNFAGGSGVFVGTSLVAESGQTIGGQSVSSISPTPMLLDSGQVLFSANNLTFTASSFVTSGFAARRNNAGQTVYVSSSNQRFDTIGLASASIGAGSFLDGKILSSIFSTAGSPSINNAGQIAFWAGHSGGASTGIFRVTFGGTPVAATEIKMLASSGQAVGSVTLATGFAGDLSMNDSGTVAFSGFLSNFTSAILTQNGLVIGQGAVVEGKTISSVSNPSINNAGQIAFLANFTDGTPGIVLATPGGGGGGNPTPVSVTVATTPSGQAVLVDGQSYTTPRSFDWTPGSSHTLGVTSPQGTGDTQYVFQNWSQGGAATQTLTAPASATTYTAAFKTQYRLSTAMGTGGSPAGTISPATGFFDAGSNVSVSATANATFAFVGFNGDLTGSANPQTLAMNAPRSVVANFQPLSASIGTVTSLVGTLTTENRSLANGSPVFVGEKLRTGPASQASVIFTDGSALTIVAESEVTLDNFIYHPDPSTTDVLFSLLKGAMRFVGGALSKHEGEVKTPVAVIGIRGTEFILRHVAGTTTVDLIEGALDATPTGGITTPLTAPITTQTSGGTQTTSPLTAAQYSQIKAQVFSSAPAITSLRVLFGAQSYEVMGTSRRYLPWQITGLQATFSLPITTASAASLGGLSATGISGLGTNTLTWTFAPVSAANLALTFAATGPQAIIANSGIALDSGVNFSQQIKVLWGDFTDDGAVSSTDLVGVNNARVLPYRLFADINGDGVVSPIDVTAVRNRIGSTLP